MIWMILHDDKSCWWPPQMAGREMTDIIIMLTEIARLITRVHYSIYSHFAAEDKLYDSALQ